MNYWSVEQLVRSFLVQNDIENIDMFVDKWAHKKFNISCVFCQ